MTRMINNELSRQKQTKKQSRAVFYGLMGVLWFGLFLRNYVGVGISHYLFLAIMAVIALFSDRDELAALLVVCIPLTSSLQYKYACAAVMLVYLIKYSEDFLHIKAAAFFGVLLLFWELLHVGTGWSVAWYLRDISEIILCMFILASSYRDYDYPLICRMLAMTTIVAALIVFLNLMKQYGGISAVFSMSRRFGSIDEGMETYSGAFNPNGLGFRCNLAIVGLLQLIYQKRQKLTDYIMIALLAIIGVMTMSRSFLICLAIIMFLYMLTRGRNSSQIKKILLVAVGLTALYFAVKYGLPQLYDSILQRWQMADITTGRDTLLRAYHELIWSDAGLFMFGIGLQRFKYDVQLLYGMWAVPHNGLQEIIVAWGVPGFVLFFVWLYQSVRLMRSKGNAKRSLINYLPLILLLAKAQSGQFIRDSSIMLALVFALISLTQQFDGEEEKNDVDLEKDSQLSDRS